MKTNKLSKKLINLILLTKKFGKYLLIIVSSLFICLFIIQFIDQIISGQMYSKIDAFTQNENYIGNKGDGKVCSDKMIYIMKNTSSKLVDDKNIEIEQKFKNKFIYNDAIKSCKLALQDYTELKPPNDISRQKIILLNDGIELRKQLMQQYITYLEEVKSCYGDKACLIKNIQYFSKPEINITVLNILLNKLQVHKRYSVRSFLFSGITEARIKNSINKIEGKQK